MRGDAVEASRIIRPFRIAETDRTARECEGLQRCPERVSQISASFYRNWNKRSARDVEPKLVAPYAKIGSAGLDERVPQ